MHETLGLKIIENFITEQEEQELLSKIEKNSAVLKIGRNSIKRFGSALPYNTYIESDQIPDVWDKISQRLVAEHLIDQKPDSVTINEYMTGQGIAPHIDSYSSGPIITVLCLLGQGTMTFHKKEEEFSVVLPPRTLVQMRDEIRTDWKHSIEPVPGPRYSVVFRCSRGKAHSVKKAKNATKFHTPRAK